MAEVDVGVIVGYSDWDDSEATPHSCPTLCEV